MSRLLLDDSMAAGRWIGDERRNHQPQYIGSKQVNFRFWLKAYWNDGEDLCTVHSSTEQPRMTTHRIYLDTEFTNLNRYTCKLISLALVVPSGPEFYVELTDACEEGDCSDFVREIVLPQLDQAAYGRTTEQARIELLGFLHRLSQVEIISDAPYWDWPMLMWLAGHAGLPANVEQQPGLLSIDFDADYSGAEPPHHALQDARLLAALLEKNQPRMTRHRVRLITYE